MAYVFQAWLPLVVWQQVDAPKYHKGFITVTILSVLLIIFSFTIRFLHKKEKLNKMLVLRYMLLYLNCLALTCDL
jgi:hypothetical protein